MKMFLPDGKGTPEQKQVSEALSPSFVDTNDVSLEASVLVSVVVPVKLKTFRKLMRFSFVYASRCYYGIEVLYRFIELDLKLYQAFKACKAN